MNNRENNINQIKYLNYKEQKKRLNKAIDNGFYIEALAIEYAILEERTSVMLESAGVSSLSSKGKPMTLSRKLNKLKGDKPFTDSAYRKKLPVEIIEKAQRWKEMRDDIMHGLIVRLSNTKEFQSLATEGLDVIKEIGNACGRIERFCKKNAECKN